MMHHRGKARPYDVALQEGAACRIGLCCVLVAAMSLCHAEHDQPHARAPYSTLRSDTCRVFAGTALQAARRRAPPSACTWRSRAAAAPTRTPLR